MRIRECVKEEAIYQFCGIGDWTWLSGLGHSEWPQNAFIPLNERRGVGGAIPGTGNSLENDRELVNRNFCCLEILYIVALGAAWAETISKRFFGTFSKEVDLKPSQKCTEAPRWVRHLCLHKYRWRCVKFRSFSAL
ncbi:MAG: hypothetical protein ACJ8AT_27420 [Hyalangium sp.]|uniref:hypothetical protein n=1 Tax=Hyalangium sp. TaxID=2028555 RepID=UPI00389A77DD